MKAWWCSESPSCIRIRRSYEVRVCLQGRCALVLATAYVGDGVVGSRVGSSVGCTELHSSLVVGDSVGEDVSPSTPGALVVRAALGLRDGDQLGRSDGNKVEDCVGCCVGESDGRSDEYSWRDDGASVGIPEDAREGTRLGALLGARDGSNDGTPVGVGLGSPEGSSVGTAEGV